MRDTVISPERRLARHVAELVVTAIPVMTRQQVPRLLADFLACTLAGLRSEECRRIAAFHLDRAGKPESSVVGSAERLPAPAAALLNAVLAHWYEWDDVHDPGATHASAVIMPVLLAAAEAAGMDKGSSGGETFVATAAATFDVAGRLGALLTPFSHNGWMPTGSACVVAAAGGAAKLSGLDVDGIAAAMGIAAAGAGLSRQPLVDKVSGKNVLCGIAAARALDAADLARAGVVGAPNFLTGDFGLNALFAEGRAPLAHGLADLGSRFAVDEVSLKPYPCCRAAHPIIDLALDLWAEGGIDTAEIEQVEALVPQKMFELCGAPFTPGDDPRVSAQFSIPYTAALALQHGRMTLDDFQPDNVLNDAPVFELARRIEVRARPAPAGEATLGQPVTLRLRRRDGAVVERTSSRLRGSLQRPMSCAEEHTKLVEAAEGALGPKSVDVLRSAADAVERDGIEPIMRLLRTARWHRRAART